MGGTGGYSCKTTSVKRAMASVPVEGVCVLPKPNQVTCPFYFPINFCDNEVQDIET